MIKNLDLMEPPRLNEGNAYFLLVFVGGLGV